MQEQQSSKQRARQAWEEKIGRLTADIIRHPELSKSQLPIDFDFVKSLVELYRDIKEIRICLNEIDIWIKAGNERENYRKTLATWLRNHFKQKERR